MEDRILLPRLLPAGDEAYADVLSRPLLGEESEKNSWMPRVSLEWYSDDEVESIEELELGTSFQEMEALACENLLSIQVEWDVQTSEETGQPQIMFGHHEFAVECILSPPHMREIQSFLKVESLAVAIPIGGMIAIQDANPPHLDDVLGLMQWARSVYDDAIEIGLSPEIFLVKDGILKAVIKPEEGFLFTEEDLLDN